MLFRSQSGWWIDPGIIPGFLLAMALIELTPGPNMGYLTVVAASRGRLAGGITVAGITAGLAAYLALAVFVLSRGAEVSPIVLKALRWAGVLYLLVLAAEASRPSRPRAAASGSGGALIARGFLANILNPKALLFYAVLLPGFVRRGFADPPAQMLILGLTHICISVMVHLGIVFGVAQAAGRWPKSRRRWLRWLSAAGLVGVAFWLGLSR